MAKRTISKSKYLQVVGLLTVAKKQMAAIRETEAALAELLGEKGDDGYFGLCSDAIYSDHTAEYLLKSLGVTVSAEVRKPKQPRKARK